MFTCDVCGHDVSPIRKPEYLYPQCQHCGARYSQHRDHELIDKIMLVDDQWKHARQVIDAWIAATPQEDER